MTKKSFHGHPDPQRDTHPTQSTASAAAHRCQTPCHSQDAWTFQTGS